MSKKATVFILNCNPSMDIHLPNHEKTAFQEGLDVLLDSIGEKVLVGRKTDKISVILSGTEETSNVLAEEVNDQYQHVTTFCDIKQPDITLLRQLVNVTVSDSDSSRADIMDALILGTHMISTECGRLKYSKQIVLITDAVDTIDWRDIDDVVSMLKAEEIKLVIIGVGFDKNGILNNENNQSQEDLATKRTNQENWKKLIDSIPDGSIYSLDEAYESSQGFKTKEMRPTPTFRGFLHLGDNETYGTRALTCSVNMYAYTNETKPPSAKKWSTLSDLNLSNRASSSSAAVSSSSMSLLSRPSYVVEMERRYRIKNTGDMSASPSSSSQVDDMSMDTLNPDTLEKAYHFGKSLVKVTQEEEDMLVLPTSAGMWIHGFYKKSAVPQHYFLANVYTLVAGNFDTEVAGTIISAFARSLYEREEVALVRLVNKPNVPPKLGVLFPYIDVDINVLQFCQLPFNEDIRQFTFPSLDKVVTRKGTVLTEDHPLLPDKNMKNLMSAFVKSMDLTELSKDDHEEPYLPEDSYNPIVWLTNTAIKSRALNDAAPVPKLNSRLRQQFEVLPDLLKQNEKLIKDMENVFKIKKLNHEQTKNQKYGGEGELSDNAEKLKSVEDVIGNTNSFSINTPSLPTLKKGKKEEEEEEEEEDSSMSFLQAVNKKDDIRKVTTATPIDDFNAMLQNRQVDLVTDAVTQMSELIIQLLTTSFGDQNYEKAIRCLKVLREAASKENEAKLFNQCMHQLKQIVNLSNPDALHIDFWHLLQKQNISLITKEEAEDDEVATLTKEDAYKFLHEMGNNTQNNHASESKEDDEYDGINTEDLLAMMD